MGLSRNKVAVSEGAAGSPPFYGDTALAAGAAQGHIEVEPKPKGGRIEMCARFVLALVVQFSGSNPFFKRNPIRGCSSAGRAPALQAGGHGFDSHHLHLETNPGKPLSERTVCSSGG